MAQSNIAWTDVTWNPTTGCSKCSPGCVNCYAERMAKRLQQMHPYKYDRGFAVATHPEALHEPFIWKRPRRVFVSSMGDLFHEDVPDDFLVQVLAVMARTPRHTYLLLTKRPERMLQFAGRHWLENVWAGATVEDNDHVYRADILREIPATVRFLSAEPLLSGLPDLNLQGIHWLIAGGESGPGWRSLEADWVRDLRDRCVAEDVKFFFKQWAGFRPKKLGHELDGQTWRQFPNTADTAATVIGIFDGKELRP